MKNKFLPIGTVVLLEGAKKKVMVTGYSSRPENSGVVYNYNGCIFPEGFMENQFVLFNNDQIQDICFIGYMNDSYDDFLKDSNSILMSSVGGKSNSTDKSSNSRRIHRRVPKAPTKPLSKDEMKSKYGVKVESASNYEIPYKG